MGTLKITLELKGLKVKMKNFQIFLIFGILSFYCKTLLGEPISLFDEEPKEKKESTEQPDYEATLEEIEPEVEAENRFFFGRLKCAFHRGRCLPLCSSVNFTSTQACNIRFWFFNVRCLCSIYA